MVAKVTKTSGRTRAAAIAMAAAAAGSGVMLAGGTAGAATTPLGVTFGTQVAGDGSSAGWSSTGQIDLELGVTPATTGAYATLTPASDEIPADAPTFDSDNYAAGSPRYFMTLSNGAELFNNQTGSVNATDGWEYNTGSGWDGYGDTYAEAVAGAEQGDAGVTVSSVQIVADGDQAPGVTDHITDVDYDGQTVGGGTVSLSVANESVTENASADIALNGTTTSSDQALTYKATGLPTGLSVNSDAITGTATETGQYSVAVEATDVYGDHSGWKTFVLDVKSGTSKIQVPNVVGLTASAAANTVRNDGLSYKGQGLNGNDIVTAQTPAAGTYAAAGTNVAFTAKAPAATVVLSGGNVSDVTSSGFKVGWKATGAPAGEKYGLKLNFPGSENGRTASVSVLQGVYSGLPHGDAGTVTIQPELNGVDNGAAGTVYVHTAS